MGKITGFLEFKRKKATRRPISERLAHWNEFEEELSGYVNAKGSVQFPLDKPMPWGLITRIVKARVKANLAKVK